MLLKPMEVLLLSDQNDIPDRIADRVNVTPC